MSSYTMTTHTTPKTTIVRATRLHPHSQLKYYQLVMGHQKPYQGQHQQIILTRHCQNGSKIIYPGIDECDYIFQAKPSSPTPKLLLSSFVNALAYAEVYTTDWGNCLWTCSSPTKRDEYYLSNGSNLTPWKNFSSPNRMASIGYSPRECRDGARVVGH